MMSVDDVHSTKKKKNWCNDMKHLLIYLVKCLYLRRKPICNIRELQICNHNIWKDKWKNNLPNKPKLRTYISFKEYYCTEDYVKLCIPRKKISMEMHASALLAVSIMEDSSICQSLRRPLSSCHSFCGCLFL